MRSIINQYSSTSAVTSLKLFQILMEKRREVMSRCLQLVDAWADDRDDLVDVRLLTVTSPSCEKTCSPASGQLPSSLSNLISCQIRRI
eukprot:758487-Hanusia_phi.AAC.2